MKNGVCGNSKSNYRINGNIHQKHYMDLYKHSKSYDCFVSVSFPHSTQITYKSSIVRYPSNYNSNQYFSFDLNSAGLKKESLELINLLIVSLQNQHLTDQDFLFHYIYETLKYINNKKHDFSSSLLLFGRDLLNSIGYNLYDGLLRGGEKPNLVLPASSNLRLPF